ncbi:putative bifunctional diguanylate cyclase/phosphodiesterase [Variovorax sp. HJSM1_2]|uniref:putative bifunctional diguanylate cyclase/phosphodiesterase n=1 Tax=Variovorax sp. HJSM1_2 TaxID=3366263 RepID=UPI003BF50A00
MQQAPTPMVLTDARGVIQRVNAAFERVTGYSAAELLGQRTSLLRSGLQGDGFYRGMWAELQRHGRWHGDIWNRGKDGHLYQECLSIVALRDHGSSSAFYLGVYSGLSSPAQARDTMLRHGETDPITGLARRSAFVGALQRLAEQGAHVHVLALDIDGFTALNEQFGLAGGDAILRQMGLRCSQLAASNAQVCIVGRVGPDEFAVGVVAPADFRVGDGGVFWMRQFAECLTAALAQPFEVAQGRKLTIGVTTGLASLAPGAGSAAETLLHASFARQQASPGDAALQQYEAQARPRQLALWLREALRRQEIQVAYQPKVDLRSGALAGVEALARWHRPDGTTIAPSEFIPLAERLGLIGRLGDRVLEQALQDLGQWGAAGLAQPVVAVNISALQFHRADPAQDLASALGRHGVAPGLIELELTESLLIGEMASVMQSLQALRQLGVRLSIDDFGTGYSSLAYLRRFPIQYLKIDRQFVSDMLEDSSAREIVKVIVELAHRLGLRCIAEGIETRAQLAALRAMGCDEGQGYLLARPMDPQALAFLLSGSRPWRALFTPSAEDLDADVDQEQNEDSCAHSD